MAWKFIFKALTVSLALFFSTSALANLILAEGKPTGTWYDPARVGEYFTVEIINTGGNHQMGVAMLSYDNDGNHLWVIGIVPIEPNQEIVDIPLFRFDGPIWGPGFNPDDRNQILFATMTARFPTCDTAYFSIATENPQDFQPGNYTLVRMTNIEGIECNDQPEVPSQVEPGEWNGPGAVCLNVGEDGTTVTETGSPCNNGTTFFSQLSGKNDRGGACTMEAACEDTWPIVDGKFECTDWNGGSIVVGYFTSATTVSGVAVSPDVGLGSGDVCVSTWTATPE